MSKYTIGIDLGGTTMTAGIVNENYEIVGKLTWATRLPRPAEDLEKALADLCRTVAQDNKVDFADIKYVGIGTPGSVNFTTGFVGFNTNFGYYDWNLGPDLEDLLGCKVYVENDANAAAYGEYIAGGAKGYNDAVVITLGTGIGSGIILGGKILRGFNFAAGEMGHNVIVKDGIQCTCGRRGCWERYASASALTRETKAAMQADKNTIMWKMTQDIDHVNAKLAFDAAAKGDETARKVIDSWSASPTSSTRSSRRSSASAAVCPTRARSCWPPSAPMRRTRPGTSPPASSRSSAPASCTTMQV